MIRYLLAVVALIRAATVPAAVAAVVSVETSSNVTLVSPGPPFCMLSGDGPISCSVNAVSDPSGRNTPGAFGSASADFGAISGAVSASVIGSASIQASYHSSFGDFVTALGSSGTGTLITHYHLISSDEQNFNAGQAVPPFYRFLQGSMYVNYTPNLPQLDPTLISTLTEDLDITSPIVFGDLFPLGAGTSATVIPGLAGHSSELSTTSSAQILGYTVLDSNGNVVYSAIIQRSFSATPPDPFAPEPATLPTALASIFALIAMWRGHSCPPRRHSCRRLCR